MRYYRITQSFDPLITGGKEFIKDFLNLDGIGNPKALGNLPQGERVLIDPIVPDHLISIGAKLNDFHVTGGPLSNRFLVSNKLKSVIQSIRKDFLQFFPSSIVQASNKVASYWVTHVIQYNTELLDFEKTKFHFSRSRKISKPYYPAEFERTEEIKIFGSFEMFETFLQNEFSYLDSLTAVNICIKKMNPYPILIFNGIGIHDLIINESVKDMFENKGITGVEFWPIEIPDEEWFGPNGLRKQFYK